MTFFNNFNFFGSSLGVRSWAGQEIPSPFYYITFSATLLPFRHSSHKRVNYLMIKRERKQIKQHSYKTEDNKSKITVSVKSLAKREHFKWSFKNSQCGICQNPGEREFQRWKVITEKSTIPDHHEETETHNRTENRTLDKYCKTVDPKLFWLAAPLDLLGHWQWLPVRATGLYGWPALSMRVLFLVPLQIPKSTVVVILRFGGPLIHLE